ncbi:MAG TPA: trehalose-phosphatase [Gemmatimonadaceae bacterium]|nr:trehalose-phosphatase [Gemmatimonadaceae bacterium]
MKSRARQSSASLPLPDPRSDWAYFFDIDGTLVDISPTPWEVKVERDLIDLIKRLHHSTGGALALISGRSIEDIDSIFRGERLPVAGQHGVERRDANGRINLHAIDEKALVAARARLQDAVARHRALVLEDKGLSLALHYRQAPTLASFAHRLMRTLQQQIGSDYTVLRGKRIVELKPSGKDKGQAVQEFMSESPFKERLPVFVGDDVTDEYGFAVVNAVDGHSIKVGAGPSAARWRLPDVQSVRAWLQRAVTESRAIASNTR